jgi:hypothetical protein
MIFQKYLDRPTCQAHDQHDLLLVAKNDPKFCALVWNHVENQMKVIFHSLRQKPRIARRFCATLSKTSLLIFHHEKF